MMTFFILRGIAAVLSEEATGLPVVSTRVLNLTPTIANDIGRAQYPVKAVCSVCLVAVGVLPRRSRRPFWRLLKRLPIGGSVSQVVRGLMLVELAPNLAGHC